MTQINLHTSDQHLIAAQKVKIAAGDINSVILHVDFDSAWEEFTERKAIFANDSVNGGKTQDILLVGDECTVPHEVLSKDGTLEIGVTGYKSDGETKKTSTTVNLKLLRSLKDANTTIAPTMDLYMQYLSAIRKEISPISEQFNAAISETLTGKIAEMSALIEEQRQWMQGDVLFEWNGTDPAEISGTINFDRTQYPRLHIEVLGTKKASGESQWYHCICVHSNGEYFCAAEEGTKQRKFIVSDTGIVVGSGEADDNETNPVKVIGYKY